MWSSRGEDHGGEDKRLTTHAMGAHRLWRDSGGTYIKLN